ncbi:MAG: hypothetical protein M3Q27_17000 [Actinomycetota bacterium]|nr:hypothetical protein [Actinomycetota bacterium]
MRRPAPLVLACLLAGIVATLAAASGIGVRSTYGGNASVDEPQYLLTALSLWEDRDLDIADELAAHRYRDFHQAELPVQTAAMPDGRRLSPHDPLLPVVLAMPVGLGGWVGAKLALSLLAGVTAALTVWVAVRRLAVPTALAGVGSAVLFASPPLAVYGQQVYPELPAALAALACAAAATGPVRARSLVVASAGIVALPWLGVKYVPVAAALAVVLLWRLWRCGRARALGGVAAGLAVAGVLYGVVHRVVWGGWTVYASGDHFQQSGEFGVVGFTPDYAGRSVRLVGLLVDRGFGLVPWQPVWLLAVPAVAALARRRGAGARLLLPVAAAWATATWLALTMHGFWWPGRQVVVVLPLVGLVLLWWLAHVAPRWCRPVAAVLGAGGVVALATLLRDGYARRLTWVVDVETVRDPAYSLLRPLLPDYRAGGWMALHAVWAVVLVGLAVSGWMYAGRVQEGAPTDRRPTAVPATPTEGALRA